MLAYDLPTPHAPQTKLSKFADDTTQWTFSLNVRFAAKFLQQDLLNLAMWCSIKLNPQKNKVIIFSRFILARKTELNLKLYGETLKVYPQVKFLGITFDLPTQFQKTFYPSLPGECLSAFESGEQIYPANNSPSPDTCEQLVRAGWGRISVNARPVRIKFVRIGIVSGYV